MVWGLSQKERNAVLWAALKNGKAEPIKQALQRGGDPDMTLPDSEVPVLCWAAGEYYGSETRTRCSLLLQAGADPNKTTSHGDTALMLAVRRGHSEVVTAMLEKGADPLKANKSGQTPLDQAMANKSWQIASLMMTPEVMASLPVPTAGDRDSMRILSLARSAIDSGAYIHFLKPLLDQIADVNVGLSEGYSLAHNAVARGNTAALEALMARPDFDINVTVRAGRTLLHVALGNREFDIAQTLIGKGIDIAAADANGRTPLEIAAQNGSVALTNLLMRKMREKDGAENIAQDILDRALLAAAGQGHARICDILLKAGADKHAKNAKGETPLIAAAKEGHIETAKMLVVKHDVDTQIADDAGMIAYDHALQLKNNGKTEMADYLICFQPGYEPPAPPPPPPPPVDHNRYVKASDYSVDVKEKGLTMTFNFWTQQVIYRDPDAKPSPLSIVRFDELPRQEAILEAREMLERLGGKPPEYGSVPAQKKTHGGLPRPT